MRAELPTVSFTSAVLVLLPLPWHWRAHNISTISIIIWLALCNIIRGINSVIWSGNIIVRYEIWCDITTKIIVGANIGLPASVLCLNCRLAQVCSPCHSASKPNNRSRLMFEVGMCAGLPIVVMTLHYIVQAHRFEVAEDFGCIPNVYNAAIAFVIIFFPPLVLSLVSLIYGGIALRWLIHRRNQFQTAWEVSQSGFSTDRYLRLIALSIIEMTFATATALFTLVGNIQLGFKPWKSWEYVHSDWMYVPVHPITSVPEDTLLLTKAIWYIVPVTSILFFTFFGLGKEATAEYKKLFAWIRTHISGTRPRGAPALPVTLGRDGAQLADLVPVAAIREPDPESALPTADRLHDGSDLVVKCDSDFCVV